MCKNKRGDNFDVKDSNGGLSSRQPSCGRGVLSAAGVLARVLGMP